LTYKKSINFPGKYTGKFRTEKISAIICSFTIRSFSLDKLEFHAKVGDFDNITAGFSQKKFNYLTIWIKLDLI
jgi:hypothetical protein